MESGAGLLSEQEPHRQAAYDAYGEQEVQVLCRAPPSSLLEEEFLGSSLPERDDLGFYTEHPKPELADRYTDYYCVSNTFYDQLITVTIGLGQ